MEVMAVVHQGALRKPVTSSLALPRFRGNCIFFSCSRAVFNSEDHISRYIQVNIYIYTHISPEGYGNYQTDNQPRLSFHWPIQVVQRRF